MYKKKITLITLNVLCCLLPGIAQTNSFYTLNNVTHSEITEKSVASQPNVLLIIVDDQGYADLSAYKHAARDVSTPNIDRLAHSGVLFTRAYATSPVCSPSRVGIVSGRYQQQWGGWRYRTGLPGDVKSIAEYLREENYTTGMIGKNDLGRNHGSMEGREYPLNHGYQTFTGFQSLWHEYFVNPADCPITELPYGPLLHNRSEMEIKDGYTTELFTDTAIAFIERNRHHPFLLTLSYNAVHDIVQQVPEKYLKKFGLPGIPNYDCTKEPYSDYNKRYSTIGETPPNEMRKYYLANLNCLDDNLGRVLDALDGFDLTKNTIVIYIGDNGGSPQTCAINYPLSGSKYTLREGGIRVPMVVRWPAGLPSNIVCDESVSALDILPTCLDAANISVPEILDGISLLAPLNNNIAQWPSRGILFFEHTDQFAVIDGDWKLVKSKEMRMSYSEKKQLWPAESEEPMLFNLKHDIGESLDLAKVNPELVRQLSDVYQIWHKKMHTEAARRGWDNLPK
jgi:arylsulfatase A-like enzyme